MTTVFYLLIGIGSALGGMARYWTNSHDRNLRWLHNLFYL